MVAGCLGGLLRFEGIDSVMNVFVVTIVRGFF